MKILSMFVTPRRDGGMAVITTVLTRDGRCASYAIDPRATSAKEARIFARKIESFSEWAASPLEIGWGSAPPLIEIPPPPPKGPGGDDVLPIPDAILAASRQLWDSYQKLSRDLADGELDGGGGRLLAE